MSEVITNLPIIAMSGMTILPYMVIHFDVNRKQSIKAVDYAMKNGQKIFMLTQLSTEVSEPKREDLYTVGTVGEIKQIVKVPGGIMKVLIKGLYRASLTDNYSFDGDMYIGDVQEELGENSLSGKETDARIGLLKEMMKTYYKKSDRDRGDNYNRVDAIQTLDELCFFALAECTMDYEERQSVLEINDMSERFDAVCDIVCSEIEIEDLKRDITDNVRRRVDKNQKEYILHEQISAMREELGEENEEEEADEFRKKVDALDASDEVKDKIRREIKRYEQSSNSSSESSVIRNYIETMLELPWNAKTEDNYDVVNAEKILNEDHYGLKKVKERIAEFIAVRALNGKGETPVVCLVGPPGTGKTSIAASVARALNRKYVRVCLGGVRDEAEIRGHRKTYIGAMPGRIVTGLKQAKSCNPLMLLDEIDKVGTDSRGDTASALLEVLDTAQNSAFRDHFIETPIDLSNVLFIATANDTSTIPKPLLDRMEVIELNSYTAVEKFHIAKEYLVKKQLDSNGLSRSQLSFTDDALTQIIDNYTREAGVRELERQIGCACRKVAKLIAEGTVKKSKKISAKNLKDILGTAKFDDEEKFSKNTVGMVKGLAWTSVGGTTLDVEAVTMPGKGVLTLTGKLGDVMKESAQVALGYVRTVADRYGIERETFEKKDFYIHFPEGAVPKDGPSAGITVTLALLSAFTGRPVRNDVAMTGEITLHGNVLPIGGLKEKTLAAKAIGINTIIVPHKNRKDVADFEAEITEGLTFHYVKTMDEVVKIALC